MVLNEEYFEDRLEQGIPGMQQYILLILFRFRGNQGQQNQLFRHGEICSECLGALRV